MWVQSCDDWVPPELSTSLGQVAESSCSESLIDRRDFISHFRRVVRWQGCRALEDILAFLSCVLLTVTIYRIPFLSRDMRGRDPKTIKVVLWHHLIALGRDIANLVLATVSVLLCMLLLVRCLDLLARLPTCHSLTQVQRLAWSLTKKSCHDFRKLLGLTCAWKTYKYLVTASLYSLLLPASALPLPGHAMCISCWLGLLGTCVFLPAAIVPAAASISLIALIASGSSFAKVEGWESELLCLSWMNILSMLGVVADVAVVVDPSLVSLVSSQSLTIVAAFLASVWIILISLPFSLPAEKKSGYQESGPLCAYVHAMLHVLFLPVTLGLLQATALPLKVLLLVFLVSVMGSLGQQVHLPRPEQRADWRHPQLFLAGHRLVQLVMLELPSIATKICPWDSELEIPLQAAGGVALLLWALAFAWRGTLAASPLAVALRLAAPVMVILHAVIPLRGPVFFAAASVIAVLFAVIGCCVQSRRAQQELLQAWPELSRALSLLRLRLRKVLQNKDVLLSLALPCDSSRPHNLSACKFAQALLRAETHLGAEHLEHNFLSGRRQAWMSEVASLMSRPEPNLQPYERLGDLACELARNIVVAPPTPTALITMLRTGSAKRIPEPVWWQIMQCCWDCKTVASCSFALLHVHSVDDGPLQQMHRAVTLVIFALTTCSQEDPLQLWEGCRARLFQGQARPVSFIPDGIDEECQVGYNTNPPGRTSSTAAAPSTNDVAVDNLVIQV